MNTVIAYRKWLLKLLHMLQITLNSHHTRGRKAANDMAKAAANSGNGAYFKAEQAMKRFKGTLEHPADSYQTYSTTVFLSKQQMLQALLTGIIAEMLKD